MLSKNVYSPKASGIAFKYHDISIIQYFREKGQGLLGYYRPAVNLPAVKKLVDYHLRWSLIHTLAGKHKAKVHEIVKKYGKTPRIEIEGIKGKKVEVVSFLTPNEVNHVKRGFLTTYDPVVHKDNLDKPIVKLSIPKILFSGRCSVKNCHNRDIEVHHIRALERSKAGYTVESISSKGKRVTGFSKVESALKRKQIPLCREHHRQ